MQAVTGIGEGRGIPVWIGCEILGRCRSQPLTKQGEKALPLGKTSQV